MVDNNEIKTWLESILKTKINLPLSQALTNGKLLLQLTYKLQNIDKPIKDPKNVFESMEYINEFNIFCRSLEMPEENLIMSTDINNFKLVQNCLYCFSRYAEIKGLCEGIGPKIKFIKRKEVKSDFSLANDGIRRQISGQYEPVHVKETYIQSPKDFSNLTKNQDIRRQIGGQYKQDADSSIIRNKIETNESVKDVDLQKKEDEEYEKSFLKNQDNFRFNVNKENE